jgi:hypothetical protein
MAGGKAAEQYGTAMVNTQSKSITLVCQSNLRSIYHVGLFLLTNLSPVQRLFG